MVELQRRVLERINSDPRMVRYIIDTYGRPDAGPFIQQCIDRERQFIQKVEEKLREEDEARRFKTPDKDPMRKRQRFHVNGKKYYACSCGWIGFEDEGHEHFFEGVVENDIPVNDNKEECEFEEASNLEWVIGLQNSFNKADAQAKADNKQTNNKP